MNEIRLGLIGYGFRGVGLLNMARGVPRLRPAAVCDENPEARAKVEEAFPGLEFFSNPDEMLSSGRIDAVLLETPPATHARQAIAALKNNVHVLSDVPAIHRLDETGLLWDAAQNSRAIYMFGATANYFGFVETCRDLLAKGLLGKPFYFEADYVHDIREFAKATPWRIGYEPIRYCTHSLGPLLNWLGKRLDSVVCFDSGGHVNPGDTNAHDAMVAVFRTQSGEIVKLLLSFTNSNPHGQHRYLCHGTRGAFECTWPLTGDEPKILFSTQEIYGFDKPIAITVASQRPELGTLQNASGHGSLDHVMLLDFVKAVDGGPCHLGLKEGLEMTLPGLFALESANNSGRVTQIEYPWPAS